MSDSPARHLNLDGASNFRDLGGYPTSDGRTVRWRQIFRSNHLGHLTDDDVDRAGPRRPQRVRLSRRRRARRRALRHAGNHRPFAADRTHRGCGAARVAAAGTPLSTDHAVEIMRDSYRGYVRNNTHSFRTLFAHLLEDRAPLVIHCTAGKDRTGFACALILHALGVPTTSSRRIIS